MNTPEYIDDVMVQRFNIIDNTGIIWKGIVKTKNIMTISPRRLWEIIEDAIVDARSGINAVRVYRDGETRIRVKLSNKNDFLNASIISITIHYNGEKIYSLHLEPTI